MTLPPWRPPSPPGEGGHHQQPQQSHWRGLFPRDHPAAGPDAAGEIPGLRSSHLADLRRAYREIVYQTAPLPWVPDFYDNTLVCYSYSKSLSLPGAADRLCAGPPQAEEADLVYAAICGAGRALGYVCAPSLFQLVVARCAGQTADMAVYRRNRDLFLDALRSMGYTCAQPEGPSTSSPGPWSPMRRPL